MLHRVQVVVTRIVWGLVRVIDRRTGDWVSHKGDVGNGASACVLVRFLICRLRRRLPMPPPPSLQPASVT